MATNKIKPSQDKKDSSVNPEFAIQRIYVKDVSFETPNTPEIFRAEWKPEVNLDLNSKNRRIEDNIYEITLHLTVTVKTASKVAFLAEVQQAGIFTLKYFTDDQLKPMLGSFCPNVLFPYAREVISDLVVRGGFPALYLAPINFDALYHKQQEQDKNKE